MTEEKAFRYSISFTQSVSSGIIAFHGTYQFDEKGEFDPYWLPTILKAQEEVFRNAGYRVFRNAGYRVTSGIKPKEVKEKIEKE